MSGVKVMVGDCRCVGGPHKEGDWVELASEATIAVGSAAHAAVGLYGNDALALQVGLGRAYINYGIVRWSFTDPFGSSIPITPDQSDWGATIDKLLPFTRGGRIVAEKADELYSGPVLGPLMEEMSKSSPDGPTALSTSPTRATGSGPRKRSARSLQTATGGLP